MAKHNVVVLNSGAGGNGRHVARLLAFAIALAVPATALHHESFQPLERRVELQGRTADWSFELPSAESLYLEIGVIVRTSGTGSADVAVDVNGTELSRLRPDTLYAIKRSIVAVPAALTRAGTNRLGFRVQGPADATFDVRVRVHNYYGISPKFPRATVVSDEAARRFFAEQGWAGLAPRFGLFVLAGLGAAVVARRLSRMTAARERLLMAAATALPLAAFVGAVATPYHFWVPASTIAVLVLTPVLVTGAAMWTGGHWGLVSPYVWSAAITLVLLEGGLRVFNAVYPTPILSVGADDRFRGRPGARFFDSHLNSRGFNDVEHAPAKPPGVRRVVALGDSVTVGVVPYSANYLTLLENDLGREGRVDVINMGVSATGPRDYRRMLAGEGLAFSPDLVLVSFFIGNDFEADVTRAYERSSAATFFYFLWRLATAGSASVAGFDPGATEYRDDAPTYGEDRFLEIEVDRARIHQIGNPLLDTWMPAVLDSLREIQRTSRRAGADLAVVIVPDELQVDAALQAQVVRAYRAGPGDFDFARPNRLLAEALAAAGIAYLDLLPEFLKHAPTRLYKPRDTHWNLAGNKLAADTIAPFLRQRLGSRRSPPPAANGR